MLRTILAVSLISLWGTIAASAATDVQVSTPTMAPAYSGSGEAAAGSIRVRISVAGTGPVNEPAVHLKGLVLCSGTRCFKAPVNGNFKVSDTSTNQATLVADVVIPTTTIDRIYFEDEQTAKSLTEQIKIADFPKVLDGVNSMQLVVYVAKQGAGTALKFAPAKTASQYLAPAGQSVFYDPDVGVAVDLKLGTKLVIPKGALNRPAIFTVAVHDIGELYPTVDIMPEVALAKPATIEVPPIDMKERELNRPAGAPKVPEPKPFTDPVSGRVVGSFSTMPQANAERLKITINKTKTIWSDEWKRQNRDGRPVSGNDARETQDWANCGDMLRAGMQSIRDASRINSAVQVRWCANLPPYVNILYFNTNDRRNRLDVTTESANGNPFGPFNLKTINSFGGGAGFGMINGFYWTGDYGFFGGTGKINGYVQNRQRGNWYLVGNNTRGGGYADRNSHWSDGNKRAVAFDEPTGKGNPYWWDDYGYLAPRFSDGNILSSSTSVIKDGECSGDTLQNRWSAFGAGPGEVVMISSAKGAATNAQEMCQVFQAFSMQNAIRMDGGPSAAMMITDELLNPLSGWDYTKFGPMRHIAWGIRMVYTP